MSLEIRQERAGDREPVAAVVARAFGRADEALLVEALRTSGDIALSLVAVQAPEIVGYIAFQALRAEDAGSPVRAASLAPVSVVPAQQRKGIGSELIRAGLALLQARGFDVVCVLGDPAYYGRFGFSAEAAKGFDAPWKAPYFQVLALSPPALLRGRLIYPAAFFPGSA